MLSFIDIYTLWRRVRFPAATRNRELVSTYSDLAEVDEHVTTVIKFVEKGEFNLAPVDVLANLDEIIGRIEAVSAGVTGDERTTADHQHAYAALMHLLYSEFLKQNPSVA
ncbi:hypothetical protein [Amycolatopsis sp. NPDC050768]|uniref:hypothetical protein n=1 Tax=Amycolatopsis sp. NPDC050768 TaxID=3154839 RepID=UPI00340732BF